MLGERDRQDDCVGFECFPQRLGDDRGSNRLSLRRQRLGWPAARDGHLDVLTGESASESLTYLAESYNRVAHNASPFWWCQGAASPSNNLEMGPPASVVECGSAHIGGAKSIRLDD